MGLWQVSRNNEAELDLVWKPKEGGHEKEVRCFKGKMLARSDLLNDGVYHNILSLAIRLNDLTFGEVPSTFLWVIVGADWGNILGNKL